MKNLIMFTLFVLALTVSVPSLAAGNGQGDPHDNDHTTTIITEHTYETIITDDSRWAAMSMAASQIDFSMTSTKIQIGLAIARINGTNGTAASIGFGTGSALYKITYTMAEHTNAIAGAASWEF